MAAKRNLNISVKSLRDSFYGKNKYLDRALSDSQFRLWVTAAFGSGWDFLYVVCHIVMAVYFQSYWFLTLGLYYLAVGGMRFSALRLKPNGGKGRAERKVLRRSAILTFVMAFVFTGIVCLTIVENHNQAFHKIVAITVATYTFYYVVSAIVRFSKLKKDKTTQKIILRTCSLVYGVGLLFSLESMLLGTFGDAASHFTRLIEGLSGAGFFIVIVLFGIHLLQQAKKS